MIRKILLFILIILTFFAPSYLQAEEANDNTEDPNAIMEWLKNNISIRQAFDGTKNENKLAGVTWVHDSSSDDRESYLVDLAVKISELEVLKEGISSLLLYPVLEWHRNSEASEASNKLTGFLKAEYRVFPLSDNKGLSPLVQRQKQFVLSPTILASIGYSDDLEKKEDELKYSFFLSLASNRRGFPGADFCSNNGTFRGRYYPYVGFERFEPTVMGMKDGVEFFTARLYFEYWPISSLTRQYLQFVASYTYRNQIGENELVDSTASELSLGLNLYLDGKGNFALGYEYIDGEDPRNGFLDRERSTVLLKFKF